MALVIGAAMLVIGSGGVACRGFLQVGCFIDLLVDQSE